MITTQPITKRRQRQIPEFFYDPSFLGDITRIYGSRLGVDPDPQREKEIVEGKNPEKARELVNAMKGLIRNSRLKGMASDISVIQWMRLSNHIEEIYSRENKGIARPVRIDFDVLVGLGIEEAVARELIEQGYGSFEKKEGVSYNSILTCTIPGKYGNLFLKLHRRPNRALFEARANHTLERIPPLARHIVGTPILGTITGERGEINFQYDISNVITGHSPNNPSCLLEAYAKLVVFGTPYAGQIGVPKLGNYDLKKKVFDTWNIPLLKPRLEELLRQAEGSPKAAEGEYLILQDTKAENRALRKTPQGERIVFFDLERLAIGHPAVMLAFYYLDQGFSPEEIEGYTQEFVRYVSTYSKNRISLEVKDIIERLEHLMPERGLRQYLGILQREQRVRETETLAKLESRLTALPYSKKKK